jgi:hypothetical protein
VFDRFEFYPGAEGEEMPDYVGHKILFREREPRPIKGGGNESTPFSTDLFKPQRRRRSTLLPMKMVSMKCENRSWRNFRCASLSFGGLAL